MGELQDAIREHLELKRRRGADPAEVAREEQDALAPVTRSHPVVAAIDEPPAAIDEPESDGDVDEPEPEPHEDPADATQEFHVDHGSDAWLDEESA